MCKAKIYLITGFLGCGKTTFLRNLLKNNNKKVGVLQNEFGEKSIDSSLVKIGEVELCELTNGSIFCSCLKENFIDGLKELINKKLDEIYIESSGLADPSSMRGIIDILKKKCGDKFEYIGGVCLIDGLHFLEISKIMTSVNRQIIFSDAAIINKIDLIEESKLIKIIKAIIEYNKEIQIYKTSFGKIDLEEITFLQNNRHWEHSTNKEESRPKTINLIIGEDVTYEEIINLMENIKEHCYRIKGFFTIKNETFKIDAVEEKLDIVEYTEKNNEEQIIVLISKVGNKLISYLLAEGEGLIPNKIQLSI